MMYPVGCVAPRRWISAALCVGLHVIDLTLHAPYQHLPPMSSPWASGSAGAIGTAQPQKGGGLFNPYRDVKGAL